MLDSSLSVAQAGGGGFWAMKGVDSILGVRR